MEANDLIQLEGLVIPIQRTGLSHRISKVTQILAIFESFRMAPTAIDQYAEKGKAILTDKILSFVLRNNPIKFVMLGFPFKSLNTRDKVLGQLPDLAEQATLDNFANFNTAIKAVYSPGVIISIVSDGYIFNDLMGLDDKPVKIYKEISMDMGKEAPMEWHDLDDFYTSGTIDSKRERVMSDFGITNEKLTEKILLSPDVNFLYRGMMIFMEEELAMNYYPSNNQRTKAAKILTRQMMLRNEAYSNLVKANFNDYIRLSMHPSVNNGEKYSFKLIPGEHTRHSAWHSAIAINNGEVTTMHRIDAVNQGFELIYQNNQPFYFQKAA